MASIQLDIERFWKRIQSFSESFRVRTFPLSVQGVGPILIVGCAVVQDWGLDALVLLRGQASKEQVEYIKSAAMHLWLFELEFSDTAIVLTRSAIHVYGSETKSEYIVSEHCAKYTRVPFVRCRTELFCSSNPFCPTLQ